MSENPWSPNYWENCTTPDRANRRLEKLEAICDELVLKDLQTKVKNKSARILEVGCGNGIFLDTLLQAGFQNIRGIDMFPRHDRARKDLEAIVDYDCIQFLRLSLRKEEKFDIVCSHLIFDKSAYREQSNKGFRDAMLQGIYSLLKPEGLYFASERHDRDTIITSINNIEVRGNTYLGEYSGEFFPAKS